MGSSDAKLSEPVKGGVDHLLETGVHMPDGTHLVQFQNAHV